MTVGQTPGGKSSHCRIDGELAPFSTTRSRWSPRPGMRCAFPAPSGSRDGYRPQGPKRSTTAVQRDDHRVGGCELHAQSLLLQCHPIRRSGLVTLPRFPGDEPQRSSGEACSGPAMALTRAALATDFTGRRTARDFSPYQERLFGDDAPRGLYGRFSGTVDPCCMGGSYQRRRGPCIIYFRENRL